MISGKPVTINSLSDCVGQDKVDVPEGFTYLRSKEPILDDGNYRLNFNGRVNIPSVKNFQLVIPENPDNVICQFGKVRSWSSGQSDHLPPLADHIETGLIIVIF